jgi:hypothetical protein
VIGLEPAAEIGFGGKEGRFPLSHS